jgi:hypothetical protein
MPIKWKSPITVCEYVVYINLIVQLTLGNDCCVGEINLFILDNSLVEMLMFVRWQLYKLLGVLKIWELPKASGQGTRNKSMTCS